jgi:hypothetical protein
MRLRDLLIRVATILSLTAAPVFAGPKSAPAKGAAPKTATAHGSPKTTTTTSSPKTTMTTTHGGPKTTSGGPKTTSGSPKTTSGSPKKVATTTTTSAANHGQAKKSPASTTSTTTTASTTTPSTSTGTATTDTTTTQLNPIAQKIRSKTNLNSKVSSLLPQGMSLNQASKGFKNQGQFIAALHVSQNLGIPFADLKTAMTGIRPITLPPTGGTTTGGTTTGATTTVTTTTESTPLLSLGQAIKKLRPTANADAAETRATTQATTDLSSK